MKDPLKVIIDTNLWQDANADFLVTKDDDLLVLGTFGRTQILDYFGFMEAIRS